MQHHHPPIYYSQVFTLLGQKMYKGFLCSSFHLFLFTSWLSHIHRLLLFKCKIPFLTPPTPLIVLISCRIINHVYFYFYFLIPMLVYILNLKKKIATNLLYFQ